LLLPLRASAMTGANSQNGTIHSRTRSTPTRRRNGDGPPDTESSVVDDPSLIYVPDSIVWDLDWSSHSTVVELPACYKHTATSG
jgi:hypothetical protein